MFATDCRGARCSRTSMCVVDFTQSFRRGRQPAREALPRGVDCVVGTTGLSNESSSKQLAALASEETCALLRTELHHGRRTHDGVREGWQHHIFREAEVMEFHHEQEERRSVWHSRAHGSDHRRGARGSAQARRPGKETEIEGRRGSTRRASSTACRCIRCVRWATLASQEVIFGSVSGRRSPSATTAGTAAPTCRACSWAFASVGSRDRA